MYRTLIVLVLVTGLAIPTATAMPWMVKTLHQDVDRCRHGDSCGAESTMDCLSQEECSRLPVDPDDIPCVTSPCF